MDEFLLVKIQLLLRGVMDYFCKYIFDQLPNVVRTKKMKDFCYFFVYHHFIENYINYKLSKLFAMLKFYVNFLQLLLYMFYVFS